MKRKRCQYLGVDLRRAFGSWKIVIGCFGVCCSLLYNQGANDVLSWLGDIAANAVLVMTALIFAIYPYAAAFCDDMEYCYDRQMVLRGGAIPYALSKIITVFLSAVVTMFCGFLFALLFFLARYGMPSDAEITAQILENCYSIYAPLFQAKQFLLYAFCTGMHVAVLAGILAVIGLMCSLFVRNRILVYILPVAFLYIEDILIQRIFGWEVGGLFSLNSMGITALGTSIEGQTWQLYYFETALFILFAGAIICLKYRKKVE